MLTRLAIVAAVALGLFGSGYVWAWSHYSERETVRGLENEIRLLKAHVAAQEVDAALLKESKQQVAELNSRIQEMQDALSEKDRVCFDAPDTERLRQLWDQPSTAPR